MQINSRTPDERRERLREIKYGRDVTWQRLAELARMKKETLLSVSGGRYDISETALTLIELQLGEREPEGF